MRVAVLDYWQKAAHRFADWDALGAESFVPDIEPNEAPDAWTAEDALFVPLQDSNGGLIGVISVDEPETGRPPSDEELDALVTIARHAAIALRLAQETAHTAQHQRMLEGVLAVSALVMTNPVTALYWLVGAVLIYLFSAADSAWDLLIEVGRERRRRLG